ncbi:MAG: GNAT family N-acetyltransferase [Defluviitaleaceae bacterium]|nr:GNAT family N-acetyltransferase [Defluviitaleaceae bacterium]
MNIRKLIKEEFSQHEGICQKVFFDIPRRPLEEAQHDGDENVSFGAFDDGGQLQSALTILPYTMRVNDQHVKMGGIGNVVTLPEARGKGFVREIFRAAFSEMIDAGQMFSFLFPFSYVYYRKLGYEMCHPVQMVSIPIDAFASYRNGAQFEAYTQGHSTKPFAEIYEGFAQCRNLSIVRSEDNWKKILNRDPYHKLQFTYLGSDAYILYDAEKSLEGNRLVIKECCWKTPEALGDIFGFLSNMGAEFSHVKWMLPCDVNIHALFPELYKIDWQINSSGMNRIMDVQAALSTLHVPEGSGKITINVEDSFWKSNSGAYIVEWESGKLVAKKLQSVVSADLSTTIQTLTQLTTGYLTPEESMYKPCTTILGAYKELAALFPKQKLFMTERF